MPKPLVIFHSQGGDSHCDDGFAAAWAVRAHLGVDLEFFPGVYQKDPPDVTDRDVIMVDFCYKRPVIDQMIAKARSLLILDHHKTAAEDLAGLPPAGVSRHEWEQAHQPIVGCKVGVLFDMKRSGAGISWDFYSNNAHTGEGRPEFINYIEDRDLWRKTLPGGDEFTIALRSYPQDFQVWDRLVSQGVKRLIDEGRHIWRYYHCRIEELKQQAYEAVIETEQHGRLAIWVCNANYFAASELAGELAERPGAAFGACSHGRGTGQHAGRPCVKYRRLNQPGTVEAVRSGDGWKVTDEFGNTEFWLARFFFQFFEPVPE